MKTIPTSITANEFGTSADKIEPSPSLESAGYIPSQQLPAEHMNWFMSLLTRLANADNPSLRDVWSELNTILAAAGLSADNATTTQVKAALDALYILKTAYGTNWLTAIQTALGTDWKTALAATAGSGILTELKKVDGRGSGLDADIVRGASGIVVDTTGGNISLAAWLTEFLVCAYAGASNVALPQAATCIGYRVRIAAGYLGSALITITPYSGDSIGGLSPNTPIFLQNSDGGGNIQRYQSVELIAIASGTWIVANGDVCPDQSVLIDGSAYAIGRLHRLPLNDTTDKTLTTPTLNTTPSTWSAAIQASGVKGVPAKAKAIRVRVVLYLDGTGSGTPIVAYSFSDNNSNTPNGSTAHPYIKSSSVYSTYEIDIPLSASGCFYYYVSSVFQNITAARIDVCVLGYYMGD